jgi:hypothetical protein
VSHADHEFPPSTEDDLELDQPARPAPSAPQAAPTVAPRPGAEKRPIPPIRAIPPLREKPSVIKPVLIVALLGVGAYGGYFGYCRYKIGERTHAFFQEAQDLHQALMRTGKTVGPEDVRQVILGMARKAGIDEAKGEDIHVTIEPLTDDTMRKLPAVAQTALSIAAKVPSTQRPAWLVGFKASFTLRHGVAKQLFEPERYTWFEWAKP